MRLTQKNYWTVNYCSWSPERELTLGGGQYITSCTCGHIITHKSNEILIDREVGGKHWICITFFCDKCNREWEEERQLEVTIQAKLV